MPEFVFVGLPYLAIMVAVVGTIYRTRAMPYSYSSLSSQLLENRKLLWGSAPWHIGILVILVFHFIPVFFGNAWERLVAFTAGLVTVESAGLALAILALTGLALLLIRRLFSARLQAVTSMMDLAVVGLLLVQVMLGMMTALTLHWGSRWALGTTVPYFQSLFMLQPDASYITQMPALIQAHIIVAWLLVLLLPFTRLVHLFALPWRFWFRPPQRVIWNYPARPEQAATVMSQQESRRQFLLGAGVLLIAGALFAGGTLDKLIRYLLGPHLSSGEEAEVLGTRLERLQATVEQQKLALERVNSPLIFVAGLSALRSNVGTYFIDYQMNPGMAFLGKDGLPHLLSAKCTHLGCTVANQVNNGLLLCPCHNSHFDINTGIPIPGSPAKLPLPEIGWVITDASGKEVASKPPHGPVQGSIQPGQLSTYDLYIAKRHTEVV